MSVVRWLSKKIRSKKLWVFVFVICLIAFGVFHILKTLNAPSVGTVNLQTSQTMVGNKTPVVPIKYKGSYISFTYPARYRALTTKNTSSLLQINDFYSSDKTEISIAIGVTREVISNDSGVYLRQHEPQIYQPLPSAAGTLNFVSTNNGQEGYERDEFIVHSNLVASIVITAPSQETVGQDFSSIVNSIVWQ